jgi:DNA-binding SARP family transcriptional activator
MEIRLDGVLLDHWPRRKAKLVLAALLLYPRGLLLPQMIEVLGGDEVTQAAVTTIKVDVSALRRALEPDLGKGQASRYVVTSEERYALEWETVGYLDVRAFEEAVRRGDQLRETAPAEAVDAYDEALSHYRGNLLDDGIFARFFEAEREKFRQQAAGILLWQAAHFKSLGNFTRREQCLQRAVDVAPTQEDVYVALMQLQLEVGRSERIRQVYWDCRKSLKAHLGLAPSDAFEAAYAAVAQGA